jgi:hypothetical protein
VSYRETTIISETRFPGLLLKLWQDEKNPDITSSCEAWKTDEANGGETLQWTVSRIASGNEFEHRGECRNSHLLIALHVTLAGQEGTYSPWTSQRSKALVRNVLEAAFEYDLGPSRCSCEHDCCGHWFGPEATIKAIRDTSLFLVTWSRSMNV